MSKESELANQIKAYRESHGLTQNDLGKLLGLRSTRPQGTIWGYEQGIRPRPATLKKIKELLDSDKSDDKSVPSASPNHLSLEESIRAIDAKGFNVTITPRTTPDRDSERHGVQGRAVPRIENKKREI